MNPGKPFIGRAGFFDRFWFNIVSDSGGSFTPSAEYQAVLTEAGVQGYTIPTLGNKTQENALFEGLVADSNWNPMDVAYISVNSGSEEFGFLNIKSPGTYRLTKSGTTVWASNAGAASNGTDGYYNTGYNPSVNGVGFLRDSNSFSIYYLTDSLQSNRQGLGAWLVESSAQGYFLNPRHTGDVIRSQNNNGTTTSTAILSSIGLTTIARIASTEYRVIKNGVHIATITATSSAIVNLVCYLMAQRQTTVAGGFDTRSMGWWDLGGPPTNHLHKFNRLNTYMMNPEGTTTLLDTDVLCGHSNAVGWTTGPISSLPAPLQGPITNALIYNPTNKAFETLDAGTNNQANSALYHGIEITYMNTLVTAVGQRGLIKFALGGTILHNSNASDSWHPSNTSLAGLYKGLLSRINQARCVRALNIKNVIIWLGENDGQNESYANEFEVSMTLVISTLRADLQLPNLVFVLIKPHSAIPTYTFIDTIRTAIDNIAAADANVYAIETDPYDPTTLHPNSAAYQAIGTDAADITKTL